MYDNYTSNVFKIDTYVPTYSFSCIKAQLRIATTMSSKGLKTDTYRGPFLWILQDVRKNASAVPKIPCINQYHFEINFFLLSNQIWQLYYNRISVILSLVFNFRKIKHDKGSVCLYLLKFGIQFFAVVKSAFKTLRIHFVLPKTLFFLKYLLSQNTLIEA